MLVRLEYIAIAKIGDVKIPVYITDESAVYMGDAVMPFLKYKNRARQLIITDINKKQYGVFPFLEVCKYLKKDNTIEFQQQYICPILGREEKKLGEDLPVSEFLQTLMKMSKIGLEKDEDK